MQRIRDPIIAEAARAFGGSVKLSLAMGMSRATVSAWTRVPAEHVLTVERLTGVSRHLLRPDIYPATTPKARRAPASEPAEARE